MLKLNLQHFSEGEEEQTFDLNAEIEAFEKEWAETNVEETETEDETDDNDTEEQVSEEVEEPQNDEEMEEEPQFQNEKQNKAFAEMRRQLEAEKKYADVVRKIAETNGMDPEKLLEQYQEQQLQKQAEEQNVPVDVLKRLQSLEEENRRIKEQTFAEKFNSQVEKTKSEYGLGDDDIKGVFEYYQKNSIPPETPFEQVYKLANMDKLIEQKVKESYQKELEAKKKRQTSTAIPNGDSASQQTDELTDESWAAEMKRMGISID